MLSYNGNTMTVKLQRRLKPNLTSENARQRAKLCCLPPRSPHVASGDPGGGVGGGGGSDKLGYYDDKETVYFSVTDPGEFGIGLT
jgi:hypothetical protein